MIEIQTIIIILGCQTSDLLNSYSLQDIHIFHPGVFIVTIGIMACWTFMLIFILSMWVVTELKCGVKNRHCKCETLKSIRCLNANMARIPRIETSIGRKVQFLNLARNWIISLTDNDLTNYPHLRRLDLRLQLTGTCVTSTATPRWDLVVLGICATVSICLIDMI